MQLGEAFAKLIEKHGTAPGGDPRDEFIVVDTARAMRHALRSIELTDETITELEMIEFPMSVRCRSDSEAGLASAAGDRYGA
ncbi:hypothetical protein ACGFYQ_32740 [Streptomyces sp. NPDC048258]|uniref:hypothetical protein n=1 Tax=Streptomyces sp. NPDC048258 TaxID=3365527 RepID=UPI0037103DF9